MSKILVIIEGVCFNHSSAQFPDACPLNDQANNEFTYSYSCVSQNSLIPV